MSHARLPGSLQRKSVLQLLFIRTGMRLFEQEVETAQFRMGLEVPAFVCVCVCVYFLLLSLTGWFSTWGDFPLFLPDICQCLETCLVVTTVCATSI